jgi:hypothetical protein
MTCIRCDEKASKCGCSDADVRSALEELVETLRGENAALRADVARLAVEVDEAGEHGFAERMRELATRGTG